MCFLATFIPKVIGKRQELMSGDIVKVKKVLRRAIEAFIRSVSFLTLGNTLPFLIVCNVPFHSKLTRHWPLALKVLLLILPVPISLLVESTSRMPAYMGYNMSMALS